MMKVTLLESKVVLYFKLLRFYTKNPIPQEPIHCTKNGYAIEELLGIPVDNNVFCYEKRSHLFKARYCTKCGDLHLVVEPKDRITSLTVSSCHKCYYDDAITIMRTTYNPVLRASWLLPLRYSVALDSYLNNLLDK